MNSNDNNCNNSKNNECTRYQDKNSNARSSQHAKQEASETWPSAALHP